MNELMLFSALSAQRTEAALLRGNAVTERFGLTLTPEQCGRLLARRVEALRETERIEPGEGILPKLAVALCDSPCVGPENWEEALAERLALPRGAGKYLSSCAREVAVRAESLRDCGGLRGVFV